MKAAFIFSGSRVDRWEAAREGRCPSEFFYGAVEFEKWGDEVRVIDVGPTAAGRVTGAVDRLAAPLLPSRTNTAALWRIFRLARRLAPVDCVIATYPQAAMGLSLLRRLGRFRRPVIGIQCGLVNFPLEPLRRAVTGWLLRDSWSALFAHSERREMIRRFALPGERIVSCDFGVDLAFWTPDAAPREAFVLAVGNDGRRDFETLIRAAERMKRQVRIVTRRRLPEKLPPNVEWIQGDWQGQALSDEALREMYRRAAVVVVPLIDSPQPSGQSVAMQALACGCPVVLTNTQGLWTDSILEDGVHLTLVPPSDIGALTRAVEKAAGLTDGAREARELLVEEEWDAVGFARRLRSLCARALGQPAV